MKKQVVAGFICIALVGGFFCVRSINSAGAEQVVKPSSVLEVPVLSVSVSHISDSKEFNARINANKISQIRPQVNGIIKKRLFQEGAFVKEGDQLYLIDPAPYEVALANARAQLQKAVASNKALQAKISRYKELIDSQAISRQEYDDAMAEAGETLADIEVAKAAVRAAELNVQYTKVYAPISGKIGFSKVTEGALVTANQSDELATITQLDPIYADFTAQSADLAGFEGKENQDNQKTVKLILGAGQDEYPTVGQFEFADVAVDEATGMVKARVSFPNPDHVLMPGQFVRLVAKSVAREAVLVPQNMTARDKDANLYVWMIDPDGKATQKIIEAKDVRDGKWVVTQGLNNGDQIITSGFQKMKIGDAVKPVVSDAAQVK